MALLLGPQLYPPLADLRQGQLPLLTQPQHGEVFHVVGQIQHGALQHIVAPGIGIEQPLGGPSM